MTELLWKIYERVQFDVVIRTLQFEFIPPFTRILSRFTKNTVRPRFNNNKKFHAEHIVVRVIVVVDWYYTEVNWQNI